MVCLLTTLPEARGNILWQKSLDSKSWINLEAETKDTLLVKSEVEALYRAIVTDGTCLPVISDSVGIVTSDSITRNLINPNSLGLKLISDSTDISNGDYIYTGSDNINSFEIGKVIIDEPSGGTIRRITDIKQTGDSVIVKTEQATMEDLFINKSFKLSTEMIYPSQNLKSASLEEIEKFLTDDKGFIHPVKVTYKTEEGKKIKSASIFTENQNTQGGNLYMHVDFSGLQIYDYSGTFSLPNKYGAVVQYTGNVKGEIKEGYFTFDPEFKFEFEYDQPKFDWRNLSLSKGEITKFKFYSDRSLIDFKYIFKSETNIAFEFGKEWTLIPKLIYAQYEFPVGGVPVIIDFAIDINSKFTIATGSGSISSEGFQKTSYVTIGAGYENEKWNTIKEIEKEVQVFSSNSVFKNQEIKFEVYPSVKIKLYSIVGPYFDIAPNLSCKVTSSSQQNWDNTLDFGIQGRLGVAAYVFGKKIMSYEPANWEFIKPYNLLKSPANLILISGDNQFTQLSSMLPSPLKVKVTNSKNQVAKNVQVHFLPSSGSVSQATVLTDENGLAQTNWTLSANPGEHTMSVYLLDGKDQEIDGCSLTVKATATAVSTNLPTLTTSAITAITQTTATGGGNVTADGGTIVTARGICWSTTPNPTTANNPTTNGTGTGSFTSNLTGLAANTPYYVRAYATNSQGTAYGNEVTFTTSSDGNLTGTFTDSRDGHVYKTIKIGDQVWMAENLAYLPSVSPSSAGSYNDVPYYYVYDYQGTDVSAAIQLANYTTYGVLYNWPAAIVACPSGWHLPSEAEWIELENYLADNGYNYDGTTGGWRDKIAKSMAATTNWSASSSSRAGAIGDNLSLNNKSGLSALPGGSRYYNGNFNGIGIVGYWWSSTEYDTYNALNRDLSINHSSVHGNISGKDYGYSVRCIRD